MIKTVFTIRMRIVFRSLGLEGAEYTNVECCDTLAGLSARLETFKERARAYFIEDVEAYLGKKHKVSVVRVDVVSIEDLLDTQCVHRVLYNGPACAICENST